MAFTPSTIPAGTVTLKGFQEDGIHKQSQGIDSYIQLINYNLLQADQGVVWEVPVYFELLSIWIKTVSVPNQSAKIEFSTNLVISGDNFTPLLTLNLLDQQVDTNNTWANYNPPATIIQKNYAFKAQSNVATEIIYLVGRECWATSINPSLIYDPN
jgi:hypothetical protein